MRLQYQDYICMGSVNADVGMKKKITILSRQPSYSENTELLEVSKQQYSY